MSGRITDITVPDDAIVTQEIAVVGFIEQDGEFAYRIRTSGDAQISSYLGLLTYAEHEMIRWARGDEDDGDGPDS